MKKEYKLNDLIFSLIINAAALIVSVFLFCPFFEENDDAFLSMISEGAYGMRDHHLIYSNVIYGRLLVFLNSLIPSVRWHSILQYIMIFAAMTAVTFLICRYLKNRLFAVMFVLASFYELYVSLQYSKTAVFVGTAGFILLLCVARLSDICMEGGDGTDKEKKVTGRALFITGSVFLIFSALLRDSSFYLSGIFTFILCAFYILSALIQNTKEKNMENGGKGRFLGNLPVSFIKAFVPALFIAFVLIIADKRSYEESGWKSFMEYNDLRMQLLDYRYDLLDMSRHEDELKELSVSENDAFLYLTWQFGDDSILSAEKMSQILEKAGARAVDTEMLKGFAANIYTDIFKPDPLCIYLLFIVTFLFITGRNSRSLDDETKKPGLIPLTSLLLLAFMLILFYFQYSGRWTHRVVYGAMLSLSVVLTYLAVSQKRCREAGNDMQGITVFCIVLLTAAGAGVLFGNRLEYNSYKRTEPPYRDFCAYLSDNEDKLFIADTFTFQMAYRYDVFRPYEKGALDNFVTVGSWFANSPVTKDITRRYGYDNPYEALASGDDKVILADNMYPEEKTEFLNEHYENSYRLGDHEEISGITLYRMVKE